jgi:predicted nuclease of predicted toxin-antitoxin system
VRPPSDQNLSHRLCRLLSDKFPGGAQAKQLGLDQADDLAIWQFAPREGFTIVTLDADFADIAALRGAPPKIIWLRCGNQPTCVVEQLLRDHALLIASFIDSDDSDCLELY